MPVPHHNAFRGLFVAVRQFTLLVTFYRDVSHCKGNMLFHRAPPRLRYLSNELIGLTGFNFRSKSSLCFSKQSPQTGFATPSNQNVAPRIILEHIEQTMAVL